MKLYTEEQVIDFTMNMISQYEFGNKDIWNKELLKESLDCNTPIELTSDEEIKEKVELILSYHKNREEEEAVSAGFALGAKWVIDQIKQQGIGH